MPVLGESVYFSRLDGRTPCVCLGEERVVILGQCNLNRGKWRFRLIDVRQPPVRASSWATLREPDDLLTSRRAKAIRVQLGVEFGTQWREVLDWAIAVFQDHSDSFEVEEGDDDDDDSDRSNKPGYISSATRRRIKNED